MEKDKERDFFLEKASDDQVQKALLSQEEALLSKSRLINNLAYRNIMDIKMIFFNKVKQ